MVIRNTQPNASDRAAVASHPPSSHEKIPLLLGALNYPEWSAAVRSELEARDLWNFTNRRGASARATAAKEGKESKKAEDFADPDIEAHHIIVSHLGVAPFEDVITKSPVLLHAAELWTALKREYAPHHPLARNEALSKLMSLKWGGPSVFALSDYASYFYRIFARLQLLAETDGLEKTPEWVGIGMFLHSISGVDEKVDEIVETLKSADLRKKTLENVTTDFGGYGIDFKKYLQSQRGKNWIGFDGLAK